jgi:hypothetical protein
MALSYNRPTNPNPLSPVGYDFFIDSLPSVNWFITAVNLPGITLGEAAFPTPFIDTAVAGDTLVFEPINISFIVDEDLQNWREIYDWMAGIGFPHNFTEYAALKAKKPAIYSDASLIILNSHMNANYKFTFKEMFPTSISSLQFDSSDTSLDTIKADVSFRYLTYTYEKIGS